MRRMNFLFRLLSFSVLLNATDSIAQTSISQVSSDKGCRPPISRARWHDDIDRAQKKLIDQKINAGDNEDLNFFVNQAVTKRIDALQCTIDSDATMRDQQKIAYLRGLETILRNFLNNYRIKKMTAAQFPVTLEAYDAAVKLNQRGESIVPIIEKNHYEVGNMLV